MLPLKDRVVMRQLKAQERTKAGIILAEASQKKPNLAIVLWVGPECVAVAPGDMVVLGSKWFTNFDMPNAEGKKEELLILNEPDLLGKVDDSERKLLEGEYGA